MQILCKGPYAPVRATSGSAGYDLQTMDSTTIYPGTSYKFNTGLQMAIPEGYVGLIHPRSGLSFKHSVENGAGVIDSDYRGIIRIHLYNFGGVPVKIEAGDKIAQMIIQKHEKPEFILVDSLDDTERGSNGFGHTGK